MFPLSSKTLRKGTSGATLGLPWSSWLDDNPGLFYLQSLRGHRVVVYALKYIKPYLGTKKEARWKASSIWFVFYISKWLVDVILVDASKIFVFSERKAIPRDIWCTLIPLPRTLCFSSVVVMPPWYHGKLVVWLSISSCPGWHLFWVVSSLHLSH